MLAVSPFDTIAFSGFVIGPHVGAGSVDPHAQQPTSRDPLLRRTQMVVGGAAVAVLDHLDLHHERPLLLGW
jgi:hypothetical protein